MLNIRRNVSRKGEDGDGKEEERGKWKREVSNGKEY